MTLGERKYVFGGTYTHREVRFPGSPNAKLERIVSPKASRGCVFVKYVKVLCGMVSALSCTVRTFDVALPVRIRSIFSIAYRLKSMF